MNRFLIQATCIFIGLLMFSGCAKGPEREIEHKLFVTHPSLEMVEGQEVQITASPTNQTFTWISTDPAVASVSSTGLVRAIKDGVCLIHVTSSEGLKRTIPVDVEKYLMLEGIDVIFKVNITPVTSLSLLLAQTTELEALPSPRKYHEPVEFVVDWKSSNTNIVTVDQSGKVKAVGFGNAVITVSVVDKPSVKRDIPVLVKEIPITDIQIPVTALDLLQYEFVSVPKYTLLPANYSVADASVKWESSNTSVVTVVDGKIEAISGGTANVTVSLNSDPTVFKTISVTVTGAPAATTTLDFSTYPKYVLPQGDEAHDFVHKKVAFEKGAVVEITGMNATDVANIYNRDFFFYNPGKNKLIFVRASGEWDILYSAKYKYIWVTRENDFRPDCNWILGANFGSAPVYHADFGAANYSGQRGNPKNRAYMVQIRPNVYQAHVVLLSSGSVIMMVRGWELVNWDWDSKVNIDGLTIVGAQPLEWPNNEMQFKAPGFLAGYYKFTYDADNKRLEIVKVD